MKKRALALCVGITWLAGAAFAQSIKVVKPAAGETMPLGKDVVITWTSQGLQGRVAVHVVSGDQLKGVLAENQDVNGSIAWTVGQCPVSGEPLQPGSYRIKVLSMQNIALFAQSGSFTVVPAPEVSVAFDLPKGGEVWQMGSKQTVRWLSRGLSRPVTLVLLRDQDPLMVIATGLNPSGQYEWTVGQGQLLEGAQLPVGSGVGLVIEAHAGTGNAQALGRTMPFKLVEKMVVPPGMKRTSERKD